MRRLVVVVAVAVAYAMAVAWCAPAAGAEARRPVSYRPPVDGPITDPFRPPATPYGAGNRGVDYATKPGRMVGAAAPGDVVFAGPVGNSLHVVVLHADGIRTSYSFLATVGVRRGDRVSAGAPVGTSGSSLHFGARAGDAYLDPTQLFSGTGRVYLVPDGTAARAQPPPAATASRPQSEKAEGASLARMLWGGASAAGRAFGRGASAVAGGMERLAGLTPAGRASVATFRDVERRLDDLRHLRIADGVNPHLPGQGAIAAAIALARRELDHRPCTPEAVAPRRPTERHIAVLVGGLGSSSNHASVLDIDTAALGYRPADVLMFSYLGGTAAEHPYGPVDTLADLRQSGRRLRELLDRLQYEQPGVPIDVIAHSQGGLVARSALGSELDPYDPRTPRVANLITLATPHHGADLATMAALLRHTTWGPTVNAMAGRAGRKSGIDPNARSIRQLAETSDFLRALNRRPLPKHLHAVSIAARRDLIVPSPRSHLGGADNAIVTLPLSATDHSNLPGSEQAQREMALALAGMPPTCESAADAAADALTGQAIDNAETAAGLAAAASSEL
jgi:peptidase M23-like protein/putative serine esterase DUF676